MTTEGVVGLGTLLKIGDGASPETFTAIAEVKDITGPNMSMEFAEFTHQQSTDGYREYKYQDVRNWASQSETPVYMHRPAAVLG